MKISARVDYGLQGILAIAAKFSAGERVSAETISQEHGIPYKFLEGILSQLKRSGLLNSHRGKSGGYELSRSPNEISVADVVRAIDGPLASVRDQAPEQARYAHPISNLTKVWIATRVSLRDVLEDISLQDILKGEFSPQVSRRIAKSDAWKRRPAGSKKRP